MGNRNIQYLVVRLPNWNRVIMGKYFKSFRFAHDYIKILMKKLQENESERERDKHNRSDIFSDGRGRGGGS